MEEEGCKQTAAEGHSEQALCIDTPPRTNTERAPYPGKALGTQSAVTNLTTCF